MQRDAVTRPQAFAQPAGYAFSLRRELRVGELNVSPQTTAILSAAMPRALSDGSNQHEISPNDYTEDQAFLFVVSALGNMVDLEIFLDAN
jgi:hypothetical protein